MEPFSQDTLVKIRARSVNHVKTASVAHLGCTRLIEQMRKNANFPMKIGVIKACITLEKRLLGASGMPLPLYKRVRGVPEKAGDAADEKRLRTLKDRIPITGLMVVA